MSAAGCDDVDAEESDDPTQQHLWKNISRLEIRREESRGDPHSHGNFRRGAEGARAWPFPVP